MDMVLAVSRIWPAIVSFIVVLVCLVGGGVSRAGEPVPFGIAKFSFEATSSTSVIDEPGSPANKEIVNEPYTPAFTQAGGHPWALTSVIEFTSEEYYSEGAHRNVIVPTRDPKDIVVDLPPGLLGDPLAVPSCPLTVAINTGECPASTQVGVYRVQWITGKEELAPIVNVTPEPGQSAEFALENTFKITAVITGHLVRPGQGYGFAVDSTNIPAYAEPTRVETTFWGVPADPSHDRMRGMFCKKIGFEPLACGGGGESAGVIPVPFLTWPTDCTAGPETASVHADSWEEPGRVGVGQVYEGFVHADVAMPAVTGCNALQFAPTIGVEPDTLLADEPVGLGVDLHVLLNEAVDSNATPQLRDSSLTLPDGLSVSPGVVDGIQACNETGPEGINIIGPESEEVGLKGELQLAAGHCPDASIVGTAEAFTPFLSEPVKGHVYLARPACGGVGQAACTERDAEDGKLYRLYLELGGTGELARTGIHFKVALETHANPATGQLTSTASETPQAPFSDLKIHLNGGPRAPLGNPSVCGQAITTSDFTPWSAPGETPQHLVVTGTPDATPSSFYTVNGCSSPTPFNPGFLAGTVAPQAGQFSAFTMNLSREDREQYVKGIQIHTPPGLLGMLSSVQLCEEPDASRGTCGQGARIGTVRVASGAGSHPFELGGEAFLTGPYGGAPFGLSIVTHVVAGPFNLGIVVVRARIDIDPADSTLTVTTDETGPYAVPQIVFGVPVRLKRVTVNIDRPNFMFNPTNCAAQQITAKISGNRQAVASVQSSFAVGGCKSLAFKPRFTVSTSGHTSRSKGASLDTKLSYPKGAMGRDANIARVKVSLPRQLPSRLTTLQKACPAATFDSNPAACPKGSVVGIARSSTPLLPVGLSGPVYFVSHGGEAFPSLVIVLQGDGVRVDLTGETFISKAGVTSSMFKAVPDVPVNTFELYLPEGKNSALAANGNLCRTRESRLVMPTEMIAQNGAVFKQNTKIQVTGCGKSRHAKTTGHQEHVSGTHRAHTTNGGKRR